MNQQGRVVPAAIEQILEQGGDTDSETDSETDTGVSQTEVRDVEATGGKIKNPFKSVSKAFAPVKKTFDKAGVKLNTGAAKVATAINPMTYALGNKDTRNAMIQSGKITHDYLLPAVVSAGKPIFDATAMVGSTMLTGNPLLGKVAADTVWNEMVTKKGNDPRQNQKSKELGELSTVFGQALAKPYTAALSGGYRLKGGMVDEESDDELTELMGQISFTPTEERYRPSAIPPELKRPVIIRRPVKNDKEVAEVGKRKAVDKAEGKEKKGKGRDDDREARYSYFSSQLPPEQNTRELTDRERDAVRMSRLELVLEQAVETGNEEIVENIIGEMRELDGMLRRPQFFYDEDDNYLEESEDELDLDRYRAEHDIEEEEDEEDEDEEALQEIINRLTGKGRKKKNIDFEKVKWGTFTRMFNEFKKEHPRARVKDLEQFANYIIKNKKKFSDKALKKAHFYKNIISK
jgi:hypothetical protein